jgi:16S rRNA (cytidine1402-2'-O)-methyltransferase
MCSTPLRIVGHSLAILQCYIKIPAVAAGTLFVVATPIGNLEDITLRALRVLREVAVVAAEDTRRTGNLLRHFHIETPLLSLHEHNERARIPKVLEHLHAGRSVALVSDAGTPGISDPGATIVRAVREAGLSIVPVPGPSAVTAAVSAAGLTEGRFAFTEFPPIRSKDRKQWFAWLAHHRDVNVVFFEAPHRVLKTLDGLAELLGNQPIVVGREVTKIHEEWKRGSASELAGYFKSPQGEFVFVIPAAGSGRAGGRVRPCTGDQEPPIPDDSHIAALFGQLTNNKLFGRREAIREVARTLGMSSKAVYDAIERAKQLGE